MKKLFLFTIPLVLLASCEKDPDMENLDGDLAVYTDYAPDADFGSFDTYYLPDSILEVNGNRATFWKDENSDKIISEIESEMNDKGYTRTGDKETKQPRHCGRRRVVSRLVGLQFLGSVVGRMVLPIHRILHIQLRHPLADDRNGGSPEEKRRRNKKQAADNLVRRGLRFPLRQQPL